MRTKQERFLYGLMKLARSYSFIDFLEGWELTEKDYEAIAAEIVKKLGIDREKAGL